MLLMYLVLVIAMGWLYLRLPTSFLPEEDQGYVIANIELPSGATANRTIEIIEQVEEYFGKQPPVANIITVQGFSFNGHGLNSTIAFVTLKDFSERKVATRSAHSNSVQSLQSLLLRLHDSLCFPMLPPP